MSAEHKPHQRLLLPEDAERWRERVKHGTAPNGVRVMVDEIERLVEQLEASERALAASKEIGKWALETKRCDEPSPQGDMLCDREPGHEGSHVNWQAAEWSQASSPASEPHEACPAVSGSYRCTLARGHEGLHIQPVEHGREAYWGPGIFNFRNASEPPRRRFFENEADPRQVRQDSGQ